MKYLKIMGLFAAAMSLPLLAACGGGSGNNNNNNNNNPPSVSISIMPPTTLTMLVGESKTLNVAVTPQDTVFTVSVVPASGSGCVKSGNNAVACTPTAAGTYTVTVTADATKTATAQINVLGEEVEIDESAGEITEITSEHGDIRIPISFTAIDDWTASITDHVSILSAIGLFSVQDDCDVEPKSGGAGEHTINVTCAPNATGADRLADIVISTRDSEWSVTITQKPTPQGVTFTPGVFTAQTTLLTGINDSGQMAGGIPNFQGAKAYLFDGDTYNAIAHPNTLDYPTANNYASKINNPGHVVGAQGFIWLDQGAMMSDIHGFVYHDGAYHDFEDFPSTWSLTIVDFGINDSGHVVGSYNDTVSGKKSCFLKIGAVYTTIDYPGAAATYCTGINNNELIVGYFVDGSGKYTGFLYDESKSGNKFTVISHPDGSDSGWINGTSVYGINDSGMMAGYYLSKNGGSYGFLHDGNDFVKIIAHPDARVTGVGNISTLVFDVNNSGQIVGSFVDDSGQHGFLLEQSNYSSPPVNISIMPPTTLTMFVGETKTLNVLTQNTDFTVSADPASGCIKNGNNAVVCTPAAAGTYTIAVTATADATKKAMAQVNVLEEEIEIIKIIENSGGIKEIVHADRTESISVSFKSPDNWTAVSGNGDCSVTPAGGVAGDDITVNVTCTPNDTGANRVINITISAGNAQLVVPVTQKPTPKAIFTAIEYPGAETTSVQALNNSGQVIGGFRDSSNVATPSHAFLYDSKTGNYTAIDPPGSTDSLVSYINDSGQVVGTFNSSNARTRAFLYDSKTGSYTVINPPGILNNGLCFGINEFGQVIGTFQDSERRVYSYLYDSKTENYTVHPFSPDTNIFTPLGMNNSGEVFIVPSSLEGKSYSYLYDSNTGNYTVINPTGSTDMSTMSLAAGRNLINDSGQVVGFFVDSNDRGYGFLYDSKTGDYTVINPTGSTNSSALGINDSGQVIGSFGDSEGKSYSYVYDSNTGDYTVIDPTGSTNSYVSGINDSGQVVGTFYDSDDVQYGYLYDGDRLIEIAYPGATTIYYPRSINNSGQIIGIISGGNFLLEFEGL